MKRTTIPAVALAVAVPFASAHVVASAETLEGSVIPPGSIAQPAAPETSAAPEYTVEQYKLLVADAIGEMINEYREANGLPTLVMHSQYNDAATRWSEQMAADVPALGLDGAHRHSDNSTKWRSGENLAYNNSLRRAPERVSAEGWGTLAASFFDQWHESDTHNANMLNPSYQGMGVGIAFGPDGVIFATTQFFIDDTPVIGGNLKTDGTTAKAKQSGEAFYVPSGAREILHVPAPTRAFSDTKSYTVTPQMTVTTTRPDKTKESTAVTVQLDKASKAAGKRRGLDPRLASVAVPDTPTNTAPSSTAPAGDSKPATDSKPASKGSSTGAIVGIVIAVLAVIGVAAAWPEISKHLPQ